MVAEDASLLISSTASSSLRSVHALSKALHAPTNLNITVRRACLVQSRQLHKENAQLKERAQELEAANRALAAEAYRWQRRYEDRYGQAAAGGQAPPADAPPAASLEHGPYFAPTPDRRVMTPAMFLNAAASCVQCRHMSGLSLSMPVKAFGSDVLRTPRWWLLVL